MMTEKTYNIILKHIDIRREVVNYIDQAKALGIEIGGYGDFTAYVQLVQTVAQIEHNKQVEYKVREGE